MGTFGLDGISSLRLLAFFYSKLKWSYWTESPAEDKVLELIAERDFGKQNVEKVTKAWRLWSEGIRCYISTNEDQYGPFRIGPSYPLVFRSGVTIPSIPYAMFGGNKICNRITALMTIQEALCSNSDCR